MALGRLGKPRVVLKAVVVLGLTWFLLGWAKAVPISLQHHFFSCVKTKDTLQER